MNHDDMFCKFLDKLFQDKSEVPTEEDMEGMVKECHEARGDCLMIWETKKIPPNWSKVKKIVVIQAGEKRAMERLAFVINELKNEFYAEVV